MIKKIFATIGLAAGVLLFSSCGEQDTPRDETGTPVAVQVSRATVQHYPQSFQFSGTVKGVRRVNLSTKVMGEITEMPVEKGDRINRGQVLVRIKDASIRAQLQQVKANLSEARVSLENTRTNYKRIEALYEDSSATRKELDDIRTRLEVSESRVAALESKLNEVKDLLNYTVIESPIEGYVVGKFFEKGDLASPGQPLLTVEEVERLEVIASVPESQVGLFSIGDTATVKLPATGRNFRGQVVTVNPSGDRMTRQFEIKIQLPDGVFSAGGINPGMYARVRLNKGSDEAVMVPKSALLERGQLTGLYTVNDSNELVLRWVRTGRESDGSIEVLSGLNEGETYVTSHEMKLEEGQAVTIQ